MLGHSIVSEHFMEPEGSIPNPQELSTCSYPEPDQYIALRISAVSAPIISTCQSHHTFDCYSSSNVLLWMQLCKDKFKVA
jgi:hypothetical protein